MATLTIKVDESLLGRARLTAQRRGLSIQEAIMGKLEELAEEQPNEQFAAMKRALARAGTHPSFGFGTMPSRDERNEH